MRVPHGLQDDVRVTLADAPTASTKGFDAVKMGFVATVHLSTTDKVRDGVTTMSVVAKDTATAPPPEAPAITVIDTHGALPLTHETALPNVMPVVEAFSVAFPPEGLGSVGVMQHVMPLVYVTPVTSSTLLMLHVTVFGVSTTT